jgi:alkylation response protein AidB-like acyl-CoA dehydrogenase
VGSDSPARVDRRDDVRALPDFRLPPDLTRFRAQVRDFLSNEMGVARATGHQDRTDLTGWDQAFERSILRRAGDEGILGVSLPTEFGGGGHPPSWHALVSFEAAYHDAPLIDTAAALVAPTVIAFGSDLQRVQFLPAASRGTVNACIAYTEAGAGSDLSNVATVATPIDDGFVLTGEKVLVTGAHKADWCCTIARTDPGSTGRHGLSMFLVDMRTPRVDVVRHATANRWTLSTIRFDGATVGPDAVIGEVDRGWRQLTGALLGERSGTAWLGWATRNVEGLLAFAAGTADRRVRDDLADLVVRLFAGVRHAERVLALQDAGVPPVVEGAMSKVFATELLQRIATVGARVLGPAVLTAPGWFGDPTLPSWFAYEVVERLHPTLSAGANEIQRTTIAQVGLGLPPEPRNQGER